MQRDRRTRQVSLTTESELWQAIRSTLNTERMNTRAAVSLAFRHLTPEQRIQVMTYVMKDSRGEPELRNAAYRVLVETHRELGNLEESLRISKLMLAENTDRTE